MKRRGLLAIAGAATAGLTGCLDGGSDDRTPTGTEEPDDPETPTDDADTADPPNGDGEETESPTGGDGKTDAPTETGKGTPGEPRLVDREMKIQSVECGGSGEDRWEVDVDDGVVTVDGAIGGNNACYSARVDTAEYDGDADVLHVVVESYDDSTDGEACADCIADVFYRATFTFEGGEPGDVDVHHDGRAD